MNQINSSSPTSRYFIGIDLGTTNSAVAYFDHANPTDTPRLFRIPQKGKYGNEEALPMLPSFLYLGDEPESNFVGTWAKTQGLDVPTRLIHSAKSWLSNQAVGRKERILPFEVYDPSRRLSAVEVSAHYLTHIKQMWNIHMAKNDPICFLEEQDVVLTIPASFDEVARTLTVEAAHLAGIRHLTLLEEPQAAFYNWLMENGKSTFKHQETILVCDVGGGTTDFSLIDVMHGEKELELRRMAVGKHLLLGGDNMDAALCHALEKKIGQELDAIQYLNLLHQTRMAKEILFNSGPEKTVSIFIAGKGTQVVGGSHTIQLTYDEAEAVLLNGFFGAYNFDEAVQLEKGSGIRQMGLSYESEPSITKQLAHFLHKSNCHTLPTYLLFNGGAFKPKIFQNRIIESLQLWFKSEQKPTVLPSSSLDLAVARGAAYFSKLRQTQGTLIKGGIPRAYYLDIQGKALTILPRGADEGTHWLCPHPFSLVPNQPVSFQLYYSHTRLSDVVGSFVPIEEEEMTPLPTLQTVCKYGTKETKPIAVQVEVHLTPIGTIELWLLAKTNSHRWKLEFQLRDMPQDFRPLDETLDVAALEAAQSKLVEAFSIGQSAKLNTIITDLERILGKPRQNWSVSLLRGLFDVLLTQSDKRVLSNAYETRFWNLAGFLLRPGMGYPLDDHRIKQVWKLVLSDMKKPKSEEVQIQQWICFRRVAAGLSKGQQIELFKDLFAIKQKKKGYAYAEHLRALASLERVDIQPKIKLGNTVLKKILAADGEPCDYWALARLGARVLFYGAAANVVPRTTCEEWVLALINTPAAQNTHLPFTLAMLGRQTHNRSLDLSSSVLEQIAPLLTEQDLLLNEHAWTLPEQERFFGDSLPSGLILHDLKFEPICKHTTLTD